MMRALFIINPSSGRQNMRPQLEKIIGRLSLMQKLKEVDVFYTQKKDDAFLRAKILQPRDYDFVVAVGGDGTVNEVIGGIITSGCDIPLAIIAGGTVNDFANYLHLPKTPEAFCRMIDDFQTRYVDVGKIGEAYFANVVAAGAFTDISFKVPKDKKARLGAFAYYLEGVGALPELFNSIPLKIEADGQKMEEDAIMILVSNTKSVGGFKQINPRAHVSDGLFDVMVVRKCELTDMIALSKDILLNKHLESPFVNSFQARSITIDSPNKDLKLDVDGEIGPHFPVTIENIQQVLRIVIPARKKN